MLRGSVMMVMALGASASLYNTDAVSNEMIDTVNNMGTTWTAHQNPNFIGASLAVVQDMCGTIMDPENVFKLPLKDENSFEEVDLPESFDSREGFPKCANIIGHIRDQSTCGSCWAFSSTESFNDRLCIATDGAFQTLLSTEETTSCCGPTQCYSYGCNGGQPSAAWQWFTTHGVVTGGGYDDNGKSDTCYPYQFPSCAHHVVDPTRKNCTAEKPTPKCMHSCPNKNYPISFNADHHKAKTAYSLPNSVSAIQKEIYAHGPVTGAFEVYADFPTYKSGVYQHVSGQALGGHAIKIIGWGVEDGTPYWLINNSWNNQWGDHGTFKILRGSDHCGIEAMVSAGLASSATDEILV